MVEFVESEFVAVGLDGFNDTLPNEESKKPVRKEEAPDALPKGVGAEGTRKGELEVGASSSF